METRGDGDAAALRVLTQRPLLRHIASFMSGLPFLAGEFEATISGSTAYKGSLPQLATRRRDLGMLKLLHRLARADEYCGVPKLQFCGVTRCAVQYDSVDILRWISSVRAEASSEFDDDSSGLLAAAVTSYFDDPWVMNWVLANYGEQRGVTLQEVCAAAAIGNVNAIKWLHAAGSRAFSPLVMDTAAAHGHLNIVQFLHANRREGCTRRAMHGAAVHNYADVVEFLGEHRQEGPEEQTLAAAAGAGHLRVVELLCRVSTRGCLYDAHKSAGEWGHAEVARFLKRQMIPGARRCSLDRHSQPDAPRPCQRSQFDRSIGADVAAACGETDGDDPRPRWWLRWMCQ